LSPLSASTILAFLLIDIGQVKCALILGNYSRIGWEAGTVGSVTTAKGGYAFKSKQFVDEGNPVIKIKNISSSGTVNTLDCQCIDDDIASTASRFKLSNGDLLMAMTGATVGKSGIYVSDGRDGYLNQRVARFESKVDSSKPCWFTYNLVTKDSIFEQRFTIAENRPVNRFGSGLIVVLDVTRSMLMSPFSSPNQVNLGISQDACI
jgi:hypothetical protein